MTTSQLKKIFLFFIFCISLFASCNNESQNRIDRKSVVARHTINIKSVDTLSSLTVGNGRFAFTVDVTGLQTFPEHYQNGVPLGTQSEWGWHSFTNTERYRENEALREYELEGKKITYMVQSNSNERSKGASDYFRINQHRLQLGNIGLDITKPDGSFITPEDIKDIDQKLDLWTGEITSKFSVDNVPVEVITYAHMEQDAIAAKVRSALIEAGRIKIRIRFPFPTDQWSDYGTNYLHEDKHNTSLIEQSSTSASLKHSLDTTSYFVHLKWSSNALLKNPSNHYFTLTPSESSTFEFSASFSSEDNDTTSPDFQKTKSNSMTGWESFWKSGGAIDFSESKDPRAFELERRIILSQYLTRAQCAGQYPPQETGLTYNSWYGKPHLEMHWWHAIHFALWGRPELMEQSMDWYFRAEKTAREIATRQGFDGVRWQKMTDNQGHEVPSSVGAFLIWQQPHLIYMAELLYRENPSPNVVNKWKDLIFKTADFMASFPTYDSLNGRYNLGKGLIPAQECFKPEETFNPTYELAYWKWALNTAQQWRTRSGLDRNKKWDEVLNKLAPAPIQDDVYLAAESTRNCYDENSPYKIDHPAVLAALSTLPAEKYIDTITMHRTYDLVQKVWDWNHTWGWDFPLVAMTATRLHQPEKAIDDLFKNIITNTYLPNGHNYQSKRLTIYLPGNGALLSAIAMMCAGFDENNVDTPGFPKDGSWKVKWEGLKRMP